MSLNLIMGARKEQLKRLEQENEKLKQKLNEWEKELQSNERIINRLIKENEELKERKDKYYQRTLDLEIVVSEYQQTLEEIREIAKENIKEKVHNPDIDIILDKINKVLND